MNARIEVDTAAIASNVRVIDERAGRPVVGIVKANGYGHGAALAGRAMLGGGAVMLGVVDLGEALALRADGITAPLLCWIHARQPDWDAARAAGVRVGLSSAAQLESAAAAGGLTAHLKVDTGLGRGGFASWEWPTAFERALELQRAGRIRIEGLFSHLANTSVEADRLQAERFAEACELAEPLGIEWQHLTASEGTLAMRVGTHIRSGAGLYGIHPAHNDPDGVAARELGLRPALRLVAPVTDGVAPLGFRDGLVAAEGAEVLVGERRVRVAEIGVRALRLAEPVDGHAVVIGDPARGEPGAGEWAERAGSSNYEVLTRLAPHLERVAA